ncbi:MAG: hypothetical protein Kow0069_34130 [Promethearchaeota archaeon]
MVNKGKLEEVGGWPPVFSDGDAFLVDCGDVIYTWNGEKCTTDEKETAAVEAQNLDKQRNGNAKIVTCDQGSETPDFLRLVNGFRVVSANRARSFLVDVTTGSFAGHMEHIDGLYRVSSEEFEDINAMHFIEVPFEEDSLDSEDCFIADKGDAILVWHGRDSNVRERFKAASFARMFDAERAGAQPVKVFLEERPDEDAEFRRLAFGTTSNLAKDGAVGALDGTADAGSGREQIEAKKADELAVREKRRRENQARLEAAAKAEAEAAKEQERLAAEREEEGRPRVLLQWDGSGFSEVDSKTSGIFLELDYDANEWVFSYTPGESLIARRTSLRRANEIAKVGYLRKDGSRVGRELSVREKTPSSTDLPEDLRRAQREWYSGKKRSSD